MTKYVGEWTGEDAMEQIIEAIEKNPPRSRRMYLPTAVDDSTTEAAAAQEEDSAYATPQNTQNPEPPTSGAPFLPRDYFQSKLTMPPFGDPVTPTPHSM